MLYAKKDFLKSMKSYILNLNFKFISNSFLYFFLSLIIITLDFLFRDYLNEKIVILVLIFFIIFLGLPHGALDTLVAKNKKIFKGFYGFIFFNLFYLIIALIVFFIWSILPTLSLGIFLILSIFHFSEDWKPKLRTFERLILGASAINLVVFFNTQEVKSIYTSLTNSNNINIIISFQVYMSYLLFIFLAIIIFKNIKSINLLLNIFTILTTAFLLKPLPYFLCYFCLFHSIKNYRDSSKYLDNKNKKFKNKILILNLVFTVILSIFAYTMYLNGSMEEKFLKLIFIGLAALTVPHMLLKLYISIKK